MSYTGRRIGYSENVWMSLDRRHNYVTPTLPVRIHAVRHVGLSPGGPAHWMLDNTFPSALGGASTCLSANVIELTRNRTEQIESLHWLMHWQLFTALSTELTWTSRPTYRGCTNRSPASRLYFALIGCRETRTVSAGSVMYVFQCGCSHKSSRAGVLVKFSSCAANKPLLFQFRSSRTTPVCNVYLPITIADNGWLGSRVVSVLDSGAEGPWFKSQSRRCRVTVLGKLFTPIVPLFTKQQNW